MCTFASWPTGRASSPPLCLNVLDHSATKHGGQSVQHTSLHHDHQKQVFSDLSSHRVILSSSLQQHIKLQTPRYQVQHLSPQLLWQKVTVWDWLLKVGMTREHSQHWLLYVSVFIPVQAYPLSVWWMETLPARVVSRSAMDGSGVQCVTMTGECSTPTWCVGWSAVAQL